MALGIESFFLKIIASTLFKSAPILSKGVEIMSTFSTVNDVIDVVDSINDSNSLSITGDLVRSDAMSKFAVNQMLDAGADVILAQQKKSGLQVSTRRVPAKFVLPNYETAMAGERRRVLNKINELDQITYSLSRASSWNELKRLGPRWQQRAVAVKSSLNKLGLSLSDKKFLEKLEGMDVRTNDYRVARNTAYRVCSLATQYFRNKLLGLPVDDLY